MAKKGRVKGAIKGLFNFKLWMGYDRLVDQGRSIKDSYDGIFTPQVSSRKEDMEQVKSRFGLNESDLDKKASELFRLAVTMVVLFFPVISYALYLLWNFHWHAGILALVVSGFPIVLAFRYHFWYYQVKERRLGITFSEWLHRGLLGG